MSGIPSICPVLPTVHLSPYNPVRLGVTVTSPIIIDDDESDDDDEIRIIESYDPKRQKRSSSRQVRDTSVIALPTKDRYIRDDSVEYLPTPPWISSSTKRSPPVHDKGLKLIPNTPQENVGFPFPSSSHSGRSVSREISKVGRRLSDTHLTLPNGTTPSLTPSSTSSNDQTNYPSTPSINPNLSVNAVAGPSQPRLLTRKLSRDAREVLPTFAIKQENNRNKFKVSPKPLNIPYLPTPVPTEFASSPSNSDTRFPPIRPKTPPPFKVTEFENKGKGLTALIDIQQGDVIHVEKPFFTFQYDMDAVELRKIFDRLSERDKRLFLSFNGDRGHADRYSDLAATNSIPMPQIGGAVDDDEERQWGGVFEHISRVNHSCAPNAGWKWHPREGVLYLLAFLTIQAGEEITASYLDPEPLLYNERQRKLQQDFKFICACRTCSRPSQSIKQSDKRIKRYKDLRSRLPFEIEDDVERFKTFAFDRQMALDMLKEARDILLDEDQVIAVSEVYELEASVYAAWGMKEETEWSAKRAKLFFRYTQGKKVAREADVAKWAKDGRTCDQWEMLVRKKSSTRLTDTIVETAKKMKRRRAKGYPWR